MTNERLEQIRDSIDFQLSAEKNLKIDKEIILEEKELLDYITNLQEENERLKELCDRYEEEHSTTFEYWKHLIKEDYKSRNEKAIEYIMTELITEWDIKNDGYVSGSDLPVDAITPLLNILNGGDEE